MLQSGPSVSKILQQEAILSLKPVKQGVLLSTGQDNITT